MALTRLCVDATLGLAFVAMPVEALDEMIARRQAEHSCLKKFETFLQCMSERAWPVRPNARHPSLRSAGVSRARLPAPINQLSTYYRVGTHDSCPRFMERCAPRRAAAAAAPSPCARAPTTWRATRRAAGSSA